MSFLQSYAQHPTLMRKEIRLIKQSSQKIRESQLHASSSIILTGNTYNESKRTIDSTKLFNRKEQSGNTLQTNKSIITGNASNALWTSPHVLNNDSNYFFSDESPGFEDTCRKSEGVKDKNSEVISCSAQASSCFSKASHLNLSKYMQGNTISESQIDGFENESDQNQTPTLNPLLHEKGIISLNMISDELFENDKHIKISNSSIERISLRGRRVSKLGTVIPHHKQNINYDQLYTFQKLLNEEEKIKDQEKKIQNEEEKIQNEEEKIRNEEDNQQHRKGVKSPLSYQNLIKSLAKYTMLEKKLLEETMDLEKQIQVSQEQINNLQCKSNRELSLEQYIKSPQQNSRKFTKAQSQLSLICNRSYETSSLAAIDNKERDVSFITPKPKDEKKADLKSTQQLSSTFRVKQDRKRQNNCEINQNYTYYSFLTNLNISQRSKKNRFNENITKLRLFQKELQRGELLQTDDNQSINQSQSKLQLSLSRINPKEISHNLSSKRLINFSQSPFIKDKKNYVIQKNRQDQPYLQKDISELSQNQKHCCFNQICKQGCSLVSTYFHNEHEQTPITHKQDNKNNSQSIQKGSIETFPFHMLSTERLQKSSSTKSIQNNFESNSKINNNNNLNSKNENNQFINSSQQGKNTVKEINSECQQSNQTFEQQRDDAKSNKKLEILNLLSRINSKSIIITPSSSSYKQTKSFEKVNLSTPKNNQNNLSHTSNTKSRQLFFGPEQIRKYSPLNQKKKEEKGNQQSSDKKQENQGSNKAINKDEIQLGAKTKMKNTLTENIKILLKNQENRNILNKSSCSSNQTIKLGGTTSSNQQNVSMKSLLQHIFNKSSQSESNKK